MVAYRDELLQRFGNPAVRDSLERICAFSSDRMPKFVFPPCTRTSPRTGRPGAALVVAAWARYCEGVDDDGAPLELVDPEAETLAAAARRRPEDPIAFLRNRALLGDLIDHPPFVDRYRAALDSLVHRGVAATVEDLLAGRGP